MAKVRRDKKGRILRKGETFRNDVKLYRYSYTDPEGKRKAIYASDLPELREKEKQMERDKLDGLNVYLQAKVDINYVFDRYISTKRDLRSTTETGYRYTYDQYVRYGFGQNRISEIRYSDVIMFYNRLLDKGLSVSTVDSVHCVLRPTFQLAVRDMIIRFNPTDGAMAEIKKSSRNKTEKRYALTYAQERAFLDYISENPDEARWVPLFTVMFGTGGRIGEIIGLRWRDIDIDNSTISINHSVSYGPNCKNDGRCELQMFLPKTKSGIRIIPMLDKVKEAFLQEKDNQEKFGYFCKEKLGGCNDFIFCNRFGNIYKPSGINKVIKRIVDDYNAKEELNAARENRDPLILPRFSCHIIRHTFCTRLCENETNIKVIQSVMGHKDIETTMDIYAEVSEQKKIETFEQLNKENVL
jgi:integrase